MERVFRYRPRFEKIWRPALPVVQSNCLRDSIRSTPPRRKYFTITAPATDGRFAMIDAAFLGLAVVEIVLLDAMMAAFVIAAA
jgi:hypothetical protein